MEAIAKQEQAEVARRQREKDRAAAAQIVSTGVLLGNGSVTVWKTAAGLQLGRLSAREVTPFHFALAAKSIACAPPAGTRVGVTRDYFSEGILAVEILVLEGKDAGCRGVIDAREFSRDKKKE